MILAEKMSSSSESDSEDTPEVELGITGAEALENYEAAGNFIPEEIDQINIEKYGHLMNSSSDEILEAVLSDLKLPYQLAPFQQISLNLLFQKKDLLVLSPTGTGKGKLIHAIHIR